MKRLRRPIRAIREPFGKAGLAVAMIALIAALGGSAIAAKGALTGKQKKEVEKIAKKYAGKPGAAGATGPAGPAGGKGDAGSSGANGTDGAPGANGAAGTNGKSVVSEAEGTGTSHCGGRGGSSFHQEGSTTKVYACNGESGSTGFTETLPAGKTETGTFAIGQPAAAATISEDVAISYNIPLSPLSEPTVNVIAKMEAGGFQAVKGSLDNCPGSFSEPEAEPGNLCLYGDETFTTAEKIGFLQVWFSKASGAVLNATISAGGAFKGTWAVTS